MALTDLQEAFCQEYVKDPHATRAAITAGYSEKNARFIAYDLKQKPAIQKRLRELQNKAYKRNAMAIDEAVSILADIARTNVTDLLDDEGNPRPLHEVPQHARHAIEEVEFTTVWVVETYEETDEISGEKIQRHVKRPVQVPKKYKTTGKQTAIDKIIRYLGEYRKDNEQSAANVQVLAINPLGTPAIEEGETIEVEGETIPDNDDLM